MSMLLISTLFYAQQNTDLPDYTPPSPEAGAITQYGNQEINESTGKVSTSIPLYNYSAGQLQVPISLNYTGNGVKVNDVPTWTGMNWILNAGGVITRTVSHRADELATNRIFQDDINILLNTLAENDDAAILNSYLNSQVDDYDSEPDIFNFSFNGYSGSFYLNENDNPVLITSDSEIKIFIEGSIANTNRKNLKDYKQFKIITPDGVTYFFGGLNAIEETKVSQNWHQTVTPRAVTAFYLTEIIHPINGHIYLEYKSEAFYKISTNQNRSLRKYGFNPLLTNASLESGSCYEGTTGGNNSIAGDVIYKKKEDTPISVNSTILYNNVYGGKFLSRIYSLNNNIEVVFTSDNQAKDGGFNFEYVLNTIEVKNNTTLLHAVDLNYFFQDDATGTYKQRFFLERLDINKDLNENGVSNTHDYKKYTFAYNDPLSLPARFSSSQDGMGYYNGQLNPDGLLPQFDPAKLTEEQWYDIQRIMSEGAFTADRSTHFSYKSKGVLEKIYYPTGGHTLFEYESPLDRETTNKNIYLKTYINNYPAPGGNGATVNDVPTQVFYLGDNGINQPEMGENGPIPPPTLFTDQTITFNVELETTAQIYHAEKTNLRITNLTDNTVTNKPIVMTDQGTGATVFIEHRTINHDFYKNKDYKIEFFMPGSEPSPGVADYPITNSSTAMRGVVRFNYNTGYQLKEGEGLRVKRVSDFTSQQAQANNIKRYYYTKSTDVFVNPINALSTKSYIAPKYFKEVGLLVDAYFLDYSIGGGCLVPSPSSTELSPWGGYIIDIYPTNAFYKQSILQDYQNVTISYGGDYFENGGVEKIFTKETGHNVTGSGGLNTASVEDKIMSQYSKSHMRTGHNKLDTEITLRKKGDRIEKISQKSYLYRNKTINDGNSNVIQNVVLGYIFSNNGGGYSYTLPNAWLGSYNIVSKDQSIKKVQSTSYIDAVPIANTSGEELYTYEGWKTQDHDNDGTANFQDDDYLALIENYNASVNGDESGYRKITTTTDYEYDSYPGQPTKTIVTTSNSVKKYETINRYVDESVAIANGDTTQLGHYNNLETAHRVSTPLQTESYVNINNNVTLLSKNRTLYSNDSGKILPLKIQTAKGNQDLENRIEFVDYDGNGNPTEVRKTNGSITKYSYNNLNQVTKKIENFVGLNSNPNTNGTDCENLSSLYQGAFVTSYYYDATTNLITHIVSPNCQTIYYEYDEQHRLKYVKDQDGNILSKNEYNYTTQN